MAHADKKHSGRGSQGKGTGGGAMTDEQDVTEIAPNTVLSNRDKAQHSRERGADGKWIETEQYHQHTANKTEEPLDRKPERK
ncbi:hypothetical protein M8997_012495 [Phyllobacterium sp. 21LDTY02-6]|uniref:hypothetical protein n=1 Tax=Phyllobacterium sp. 21LDTY02-6 TaxID=2944903 RepID=UPI002020CE63|nr:hypothetical protein [Phyllobacterium sp. 21LDTY02-6]MCO4318003.1 hypothetical protein [Phyllobacterium sp. 21LDTY02-6]